MTTKGKKASNVLKEPPPDFSIEVSHAVRSALVEINSSGLNYGKEIPPREELEKIRVILVKHLRFISPSESGENHTTLS